MSNLKPTLKKQLTVKIGLTSVVLIIEVEVTEGPPSQLEHPMVRPAPSSDFRQNQMGNVQLPGPSKGKSEKGWMNEKGGKGEKGWKGEGDGKGGKGEKGKGDDRQMQVAPGWESWQGTTQTWTHWSSHPWPAHCNAWATHPTHGYGSSWEEGTRWQEHRPENLPPWMSTYNFEQEDDFETRCAKIDKWQTFRHDFKLDGPAWKVLVLLAQRCPAGYRKAEGIVKVVYDRYENYDQPDPVSKFVMNRVRGAREEIDPRSR